MPSGSLLEKIGSWEILATNLAEDLEELPLLRDSHTSFQNLINRARELESRQEAHKAALRETNAERRKLEREGFELNRRLAALLQGTFGPSNEKLVRYGLKPRPQKRVRRKKTEPGAPPPTTAPPPPPVPAPPTT